MSQPRRPLCDELVLYLKMLPWYSSGVTEPWDRTPSSVYKMWTGNLLSTFLGSIIPALTWIENLVQDDTYTGQCSNSESREYNTTQTYPYTTYLVSSFVVTNCTSNCLSFWTSYLKYATTDSSGHTCLVSAHPYLSVLWRHATDRWQHRLNLWNKQQVSVYILQCRELCFRNASF